MFDIILDRDGVLNIDAGYTHLLSDCNLTDRAIESLALLRDLGARFSIATGQSGIARGKYTEADMVAYNDKLLEQFASHGLKFAAIAFCPHHPKISECECRKPKTGLLKQIEAQMGTVDWNNAWGIGDKPSDSRMILSVGGRSVLLKPGPHNSPAGDEYWQENDPELVDLLQNPRNFIADNIWEAANIIAREVKK